MISSPFINWPNSYKLQLKYGKPTLLVTNVKALKQIECTYKVIIKCTLLYRTFQVMKLTNIVSLSIVCQLVVELILILKQCLSTVFSQ